MQKNKAETMVANAFRQQDGKNQGGKGKEGKKGKKGGPTENTFSELGAAEQFAAPKVKGKAVPKLSAGGGSETVRYIGEEIRVLNEFLVYHGSEVERVCTTAEMADLLGSKNIGKDQDSDLCHRLTGGRK